MSIERQYSLPNCKLILEGLTDDRVDGDRHDVGPQMSILVNAECYLSARKEPIAGGLEFFQSLVSAVSNYAQEFLSGVRRQSAIAPPVSDTDNGKPALVQLQKINPNLHRLIVQPEESYRSETLAIDLNSVQLFDLVEAVDRFFADPGTLPQLHQNLRPLTKQEARIHQPIAKRALPAAVGVSSLAVAALALFLMPIPEWQRPRDPVPEETSSESGQLNTATAAGNGSAPPASELEATLVSSREITDPSQLEELQRQVYTEVDRAWRSNPTFNEDLIYQLTVGKDGSILGYKAQNQAATDYQNETPLIDLVYIPLEGGAATAEEVALFKVVFQPSGRLEVTPSQSDNSGAQSAVPEIKDPVVLTQLVSTLQNTLYQAWTQQAQFDRELVYRVWTTAEGAIVDYEANNPPAKNYLSQTPLERLHKPSAAYGSDENATSQPRAEFRVVFTPWRVVEISPWKGYP